MALRTDFYKIGIVVDSLDEAVAFHRTLFDYDWRRIPSAPFPVRIGDEVRTLEVRAAITTQHPRLHLIERIAGTPWQMAPGAAAHHLSYWVEDLEAATRELAGLGFSEECGDAAEDPAARTWGYFSRDGGRTRIELMRRQLPAPEWDAMLDQLPAWE